VSKHRRGEDGLLYDEDGYLIYEGESPLSEPEDAGDEDEES
jgi:hypothetical protein